MFKFCNNNYSAYSPVATEEHGLPEYFIFPVDFLTHIGLYTLSSHPEI